MFAAVIALSGQRSCNTNIYEGDILPTQVNASCAEFYKHHRILKTYHYRVSGKKKYSTGK